MTRLRFIQLAISIKNLRTSSIVLQTLNYSQDLMYDCGLAMYPAGFNVKSSRAETGLLPVQLQGSD